MTLQDLKDCCDQHEAANSDAFVLKVPGKWQGRRKRVMPGVMGVVVGEYTREDDTVGCQVIVKVADVRKAIARHEGWMANREAPK